MSALDQSLLRQFSRLVAADLTTLASLHDREIDTQILASLRAKGFPQDLALCLQDERAKAALQLLDDGLRELAEHPTPAQIDELCADYAAIYLNHSLRAAPMESVWLDEEQLAMQGPMFEVREWMARHGLGVANWRVRPDDHLVHELLFIAHLLGRESSTAAFSEAADFLDRHALRWIGDFGERVAARCATPFYAGLNLVTAYYLDELRTLLSEILGIPRPSREAVERQIDAERKHTTPAVAPVHFVPGIAPSW